MPLKNLEQAGKTLDKILSRVPADPSLNSDQGSSSYYALTLRQIWGRVPYPTRNLEKQVGPNLVQPASRENRKDLAQNLVQSSKPITVRL